jgi:3-oxoacyl-[acyl-carrier-protein] synthase III
MFSHQKVLVESLGIYLPPKVVSTEAVLAACKNPFTFPLEKITGIRNRRMAGETEFSCDIAQKAVADCLIHSRHATESIDLLICCNISRYDGPGRVSFEPSTAARLRAHFGLWGALAFDLTNACAGMFTGIRVAEAFLANGSIRTAMVVSGEYITHLTHTAQEEIEHFMDTRLACLTLGDAGVALILENGGESAAGLQCLELQTFGRYSPYCIAKRSDQQGMIMYTDTVHLTEVALKSGARHALKVLEQAGWPAHSFRHLIMHQTSTMTLNSARREINRLLHATVSTDDNTVNNLENRGNTASTSHFVALSDLIDQNVIQSGDRIVFSITASGLTIGTALYVMDELPDRLRRSRTGASRQVVSPAVEPLPGSVHFAGNGSRIESLGTVRASAAGQDSMEMSVSAAKRCLGNSVHEQGDIGLLLYCGVYRTDYLLEPAYAALLAGKLELNDSIEVEGKHTFAFDIFNGALGFLQACCVAEQMLFAEHCNQALIVAAETENNQGPEAAGRMEICEMASAAILEKSPSPAMGFSRFLFRYDPEALDAYSTWYAPEDDLPRLHVNKEPALEQHYMHNVCDAVREILEREGASINEVDIIFPPQISPDFVARLSIALDIPREKFVNIATSGQDLFTSSLPAAMESALVKGLVRPGDRGLLIAVGSGIQVGCAVYHF